MFKKLYKKISSIFVNRFGVIHQKIINKLLQNKKTITYNQQTMRFFTPNPLNKYRIKTFSSKEPETLKWIDSFRENAIMWDIGTNIGLYSIYAAKSKNCQIFAFEPSVFNLELLAKNIDINQLQEKIAIVPIALNYKKEFNLFKMNSPVWGGALSSFGANFDQNGDDFKTTFSYTIFGISGDEAVKNLNIAKPDYLKIDVDGIEHIVLSGCAVILKTIKSVLVEINDDFLEQAEQSKKYLSQSGLILLEKHHLINNTNNQLWIRQ